MKKSDVYSRGKKNRWVGRWGKKKINTAHFHLFSYRVFFPFFAHLLHLNVVDKKREEVVFMITCLSF